MENGKKKKAHGTWVVMSLKEPLLETSQSVLFLRQSHECGSPQVSRAASSALVSRTAGSALALAGVFNTWLHF